MTTLKRLVFFLAALVFASTSAIAQDAPLKSGDKFQLKISGVPSDDIAQVSGLYTVSSKGTVKLPYLQVLKISGLRPSDLSRKVEGVYQQAQIYTNPTIVINVDEAVNKDVKTVSVAGEIRTPGSVAFRTGLTLLSAISDRGGFTDFAANTRVKLIRGNKTTTHNMKNISKNPEQDVVLQASDRIIVPQRGAFGR